MTAQVTRRCVAPAAMRSTVYHPAALAKVGSYQLWVSVPFAPKNTFCYSKYTEGNINNSEKQQPMSSSFYVLSSILSHYQHRSHNVYLSLSSVALVVNHCTYHNTSQAVIIQSSHHLLSNVARYPIIRTA